MLKISLTLTLKDEPVKHGEPSILYMRRVQRRAADASLFLGWIPGIKDQIFQWTYAQKLNFDRLKGVYDGINA